MIWGVKHIIPVKLYSYTSRSRLHNITAPLCLCAFYFLLIFYNNQKYSKLEDKQVQKKTRWTNLQTVRIFSLLG